MLEGKKWQISTMSISFKKINGNKDFIWPFYSTYQLAQKVSEKSCSVLGTQKSFQKINSCFNSKTKL